MSSTLSGKEKAARVPLGYYSGLGSGRQFWAIVVFAALVVLSLGAWGIGYWKTAAMPGRLHASHAAWENDCTSCHTTLTPTGSSNALNAFAGSRGRASDVLCQKCHMSHDGQKHHSNQIENEVGSCASCHRDHQGRDHFLSRVSDAKCTCCHADLSKHVKEKATFHTKITLFELPEDKGGHPAFSIDKGKERGPLKVEIDPGQLRFNHQLHLKQGLEVGWTFASIKDEKLRKRYMEMQKKLEPDKAVTEQTPMKLDCAACHVLDAADDPGRKGPARSAGEYMLPVTYEQHCRACHPLTFSTLAPDAEIPHHLAPKQVTEFLWGVFTAKALEDKTARTKMMSDWPLPGPNLPRQELDKWKEGARSRIEKEVKKAEGAMFAEDDKNPRESLRRAKELLFASEVEKTAQFAFLGKATCGLCHFYENIKGSVVPERILPPNVPEVWLPHAKFSHRGHRAMQCTECHGAANESSKQSDILIPDVDNCKQCHSSARMENGEKRGGVRQDCVTCHRYHHGDEPLAGRGDSVRGVKERLSTSDWLKGKK